MAGRKMPKTVQTRGLSMLRRGLPMRLRHIEVFNAIMLTGSVSAAARLINVTQPAVSRTLQHAELQLGFPLFRRDKGRLTPTAEALTLHPHVQRLFAQLDEVDRLAASLRDQGDGGSLRIVTVMALTQDVLPRALQAFRARHPRVKLRVEAQHSPQVMAQLLLREADIGFAFSPAVHPGLREERLADTPVVCVAPRGVLPGALVESARVGLADLAGLPMLALDADDPVGQLVSRACRESDVSLQNLVTAQTYHAALSMAQHGLGVALLDGYTALSAQRERVDVLALEPAITVPVSALRLAQHPESGAARTLLRCMRQALAG